MIIICNVNIIYIQGVRGFNRRTFGDCRGYQGDHFLQRTWDWTRVVTRLRQTVFGRGRTSKYLRKYKFYKKLFQTKVVGCKKIYLLTL